MKTDQDLYFLELHQIIKSTLEERLDLRDWLLAQFLDIAIYRSIYFDIVINFRSIMDSYPRLLENQREMLQLQESLADLFPGTPNFTYPYRKKFIVSASTEGLSTHASNISKVSHFQDRHLNLNSQAAILQCVENLLKCHSFHKLDEGLFILQDQIELIHGLDLSHLSSVNVIVNSRNISKEIHKNAVYPPSGERLIKLRIDYSIQPLILNANYINLCIKHLIDEIGGRLTIFNPLESDTIFLFIVEDLTERPHLYIPDGETGTRCI